MHPGVSQEQRYFLRESRWQGSRQQGGNERQVDLIQSLCTGKLLFQVNMKVIYIYIYIICRFSIAYDNCPSEESFGNFEFYLV